MLSHQPSRRSHLRLALVALAMLSIGAPGCRERSAEQEPAAGTNPPPAAAAGNNAAADVSPAAATDGAAVDAPPAASASAEELLAMRLPPEDSADGWCRLYDGHTLFGWQGVADVNWHVAEGAIVADAGEIGLLCTPTRWKDFELSLEFHADEQTNSGIFLRTPLAPEDPTRDCYELNIAPADNPFPTGSLVGRQRAEPEDVGPLDSDAWHRYDIRVEGGHVTVQLDGEVVCDWTDPDPLPAGYIGLQHNEGRIAFRDVRLRPLGLESLLSQSDLGQWVRYPEMPGSFELDEQGVLQVRGGRSQLESQDQWSDFVLLAEVRTNAPDLNSGIFFRCIPGDEMMGYECQISNAMIGGDPLRPADHGTGGIFRRQPARIVAAEDEQWFTLVLAADGPDMASWVNGLPVMTWTDTREPHENPRKGLRTEAGSLMIQGHDPTTDISFRKVQIVPLGEPMAKP